MDTVSEQIVLVQEEYDNLMNFLKAPLRKGETGRSIVIEDVFTIPMTIMMVRAQRDKHSEPEVIGTVLYGRDPYVIYKREERNNSIVLYVNYCKDRNSFEFVPVKDVRAYKVMRAYDEIKMGLVNLYSCTNSKEDVDGLYSVIKELEKDDVEGS